MGLKRPHECQDLVLLKRSFNPEKKWGRLSREATCQVANVRCNAGREDLGEESRGAASTAPCTTIPCIPFL